MTYRKVIVLGMDGLEPSIVSSMMAEGRLPHLASLGKAGGFSTVATTLPAQTPVAWSTFATGLNPGGHGVFDFLGRDPKTYLPRLSLNRYEQKNAFTPPEVVNSRGGETMWEVLSRHDVPSIVLRCPCTYPPKSFRGRLLAGMGVPDLRGSVGVATFYTTDASVAAGESESMVAIDSDAAGNIRTHVLGPLNPKTGRPFEAEIAIRIEPSAGKAVITSAAHDGPVAVRRGEWSGWIRVRFKPSLLRSVWGMVRLYLKSTEPHVALYASPVNFTADKPMFPISAPADYASELAREVGAFYTSGMVEDHAGMENGRLDEAAFLDQCQLVWNEREAMALYELGRMDEGLFFCLFDTPDRVQHMFWRHREEGGPYRNVISEQYEACDRTLSKVLPFVDDNTLLIVLSDHGFGGFQRGMHLNTWLHEQGLLALTDGLRPGEEAGDLLRHIDWARTKAYSVGLGGIYLNRRDREAEGTVAADDALTHKQDIADGLRGLVDQQCQTTAVRDVVDCHATYHGPYTEHAPDLYVNFNRGYRASWETALGGVPEGVFADNTRRWGGDHIVDPELVPGVLLMNRPFDSAAGLADLAPTIVEALGVPATSQMEGRTLLI